MKGKPSAGTRFDSPQKRTSRRRGGYFFFDESIHDRGEFILGAFVYRETNPQQEISAILKSVGLMPGRDEFKSSAHMGRDPRQSVVRDELKDMILDGTRLAVVVLPSENRADLGNTALQALQTFITVNDLPLDHPDVYLHGGVFASRAVGEAQVATLGLSQHCDVHVETDSRAVCGLQLADLVAHTASMMLLETLGLVNKTVKAGENSGYDPDMDIRLGFELWAGLRYNFFGGEVPDPDAAEGPTHAVYPEFVDAPWPLMPVEPHGLYVSSRCGKALADAARKRFGQMYLGCIH